jgi:hypothetical protein
MTGITLVISLWRFCLVPTGFYKVSVRSSFIAAGLDQQRREPVPAARSRPLMPSRPHSLVVSQIPWDASRQVVLPLVYPGGHPHVTSPRNCQSLMGIVWGFGGFFSRQSSFAFIKVLGTRARLEDHGFRNRRA